LKFTRKFFTSQFLGRAKAILYGNSSGERFGWLVEESFSSQLQRGAERHGPDRPLFLESSGLFG
jgi:hypothetical protein